MWRLLSSWLTFRPERAACYALLCGVGTLAGLMLFLVCLCATATGNEGVVDRLFPCLVLYAPIAALCLPLALVFGAFALIASVKRMPHCPSRWAYFSLTVALLALLLLGAIWRQPVPSRPVPRSLELRRRFNAAQQARRAVREVNWKNLRLFPPPELSPQAVAQLREVKARYEGLMKAGIGAAIQEDKDRFSGGIGLRDMINLTSGDEPVTLPQPHFNQPSLRYWLGCVNALLGEYEEAMRVFTGPSRVPTPAGARSVRELWAEMAANLAQKNSPCEVALLYGSHEDAHLINTDPLADAFFARGQWREAAWRYERRLQVIYWRYRWMQPQVRYTPIPARVAQSYEKWAEETQSPSQRRMLGERAAKAYTNASRYEPKRAGEFHLKAGMCWLRAKYPWRALVSFEHVKKATKRDAPPPTPPARGRGEDTLLAQAEQGRQQAETDILKADRTLTPSRIAERLKKFVAATRPFDEAVRYYMAYDPDRAMGMLHEFMQKCPDPNDPLMDDALWHISECAQRGIRYVRVQRKEQRWVVVKGKRTRRTVTVYYNETRRRQPQSALPRLKELLDRFPHGDRRPEALASIAQIHYYPYKPMQEVQSYLELLRQHPDAPVVPRVLTLMWGALERAPLNEKLEGSLLPRLHPKDDEERQALNSMLRFNIGRRQLKSYNYTLAAIELRQIDLTVSNRLLRALADVSLGITDKPLASAAFACGKAYYLRRDWRNAEKQFRKVLAHPDVYNYHGWARYRLARCLENQEKWLDALRELAQVDFLESNTPLEEDSPVSAARWRINFIFDVKLSREQLEKHELDMRRLGLSAEWEMAMIARDLRDERLRDAVRRIENLVVNHPHHPQARPLFDRLCQLERNLIPTVENGESKTGSSLIPHLPSLIVQWVRRLVYAQSDFKRKMRLNLSRRHPMDDVLFEARLKPQQFRWRRVLHRLVNRLAWNVRFYLAYGGPPNAERCAFDHAFYYARHPMALRNYSGIGFDADVAFPPRWGTTFDPWDEGFVERRWRPNDGSVAEDYVSRRVRAGVMFDEFVGRYPNSRLAPRALLMALQSHERHLAVTREATRSGLFLPRTSWQTVFQNVKRDFTLLRRNYRGSREERLAAASRCRCQRWRDEIRDHSRRHGSAGVLPAS